MTEKFELASKAWFKELFRLFREIAAQHPEITFSVCEVFTRVPQQLNPDAQGKIAWRGFLRGGEADLAFGEVRPEQVDIKTIADWESTVPFARMKIDLADPQQVARYVALADKAVSEGRMQRFGDRTKVPPLFFGIHNALAERTA
jgi:hypothetical protein